MFTLPTVTYTHSPGLNNPLSCSSIQIWSIKDINNLVPTAIRVEDFNVMFYHYKSNLHNWYNLAERKKIKENPKRYTSFLLNEAVIFK